MINISVKRPYWLTFEKKNGDEWIYLRKMLSIDCIPYFAEVFFSSIGVSSIYVNGEFLESSTGRYPNRVNRHEITGRIRKGENTLAVMLGNSYFQKTSEEEYRQKGMWFSMFAFLFHYRCRDKDFYFVTDRTWKYAFDKVEGWKKKNFDDSLWMVASPSGMVTKREFEDFWTSSALWRERPLNASGADRVEGMTGKDYTKQGSGSFPALVSPKYIVENLKVCNPDKDRDVPDYICSVRLRDMDATFDTLPYKDGSIVFKKDRSSCILDFGRLVTGYLSVEFEGEFSGVLRCEFDYSETPADFTGNAPCGRDIIDKLAVRASLNNMQRWFCVRRRAFRFLKLKIPDLSSEIRISKVRVKTSVFPVSNKGWFRCSDNLLNRIWDTSRYTLLVNMHQEYESCPRNEMLFFTGDGRMDGLIDYYCFGDGSLMKASMSLSHPPDAFGLIHNVHQEVGLWDYPAWRIICIADYHRWFRDRDFVRKHYTSLSNIINWYLEKMDKNYLLYQRPVFTENGINEWTCARNRLGYKVFLNCLFYKSVKEMAFLAGVVERNSDEKYYNDVAEKIKKSVNNFLWDEEKGCYVDTLYDYIPQDGNVLAIIFGISGRERAGRILAVLKRLHWSPYGSAMFDTDMPRDGNLAGKRVISPVMCAYEAQARFENGQSSDALTLIRRCWGTMLKKGAKTFWEFTWNDPDSRWPIPAHAWSGGPAFLLPAYVLGIKPADAGFLRMEISPKLGGLRWAEGVVPTPFGLVPIRIERKGKRQKYHFTIPEGIKEVKLILPECRDILVNGKTRSIPDGGNRCLYFKRKGDYTVSFLKSRYKP